MRLRTALLALLLLTGSVTAEDNDLFVPDAAPPEQKAVEPVKPKPATVSRLVGSWSFDASGSMTCGDGYLSFSQAGGKLSGQAQTGNTDPTTDFRKIAVSGDSLVITYGYHDPLRGDQVKTLTGTFEGDNTIRGTQSGNKTVEGCTFRMARQ